ncbi:MAG: RNB domain-containing ribonuclease [Betaproteobacteria bacterium]|nr:RNB domain-containing ribonuclease [Betaproteobacteria bacterium]
MNEPRQWAVFDRGGELACLPVQKFGERALLLDGGIRARRGCVWLVGGEDYSALLPAAAVRAAAGDIELLWRAAAGEILTAEELARRAGKTEISGVLEILQTALNNPAYFRRGGGGKFVPAKEEVLKKVRVAMHRRAEAAEEENRILAQLESGAPPPEIRQQCGALLAGEEKNGVLYRAIKKAAGGDRQIPEWFVKTGICAGAGECWRRIFERRWPPRPQDETPPPPDLPTAPARAFSIDETGTFEVDDAFSVCLEADGIYRIGVHIAAPALDLALPPEDYDSRRLISVYLAGEKHPMLGRAHVAAYSLLEGGARPALSLYYRFEPRAELIGGAETRLENVPIARNYCPEDFDGAPPPECAEEYKILEQFAACLPPLPERTRTDFRIYEEPPRVVAEPRRPAGLLVEKLMRLVNSEWAKRLAGKGGLFRANGATALRPDAENIYAWMSSPLRRCADLANQRLLLSVLELAPPPKINWRRLARAFSAQQMRARHYQNIMERHCILRALETLPPGTVLAGVRRKDGKVRLRDYPLGGALVGAKSKMPPDTEIFVRVHAINLFAQWVRFEME